MTTVPIDYERIVQEVYEAVVREGDTAIDIGAHFGRHTIPLARCVGPAGTVYAVEPLPVCLEALRQMLTGEFAVLRTVVKIVPCALSDRREFSTLAVPEVHPAFAGLREVAYPSPSPIRHILVRVEAI